MNSGSSKAKAVFGNHPYTPEAKTEPLFLDGGNIGQFVYPDFGLDYSDLNYMYYSSDKLTVCSMEIGPGGFFNPPDYHPGDEAYFIAEGTITQYNPQTGQAIGVKCDEALLIPKGVLHSAYNFEQERVKVFAVIAPKIVEDQLFPTDTGGPKKLLKGKHNDQLNTPGDWDEPQRYGTVADVGCWPAPGPLLREKNLLYHVTQGRKLLAIHGDVRPMLTKFSVSNDYMHMGEYILPAGGAVTRRSEPISHGGQAVLIGLDGTMTVYLTQKRETYILRRYEGLYLPENTEYCLINYDTPRARCLFAVEGEF
ncbi:MAG: cupin domain-containing protein [Christensenellales bacterium]|jgi:mannose-6-phosphate isomerase-like protein (cupin superfamily)